MRPATRPATLALALLLASGARPATTRAEDPVMPTPPRQLDPWTSPPTTLPRFLAAATAALSEQGLADPRGCDYRSIRLTVGPELREVDTAGWVLPPAAGEPPRHAIAWNGLVYPLIGKVGPADLDADVRRLAEAAAAANPAGQPLRGGRAGFGGFGADEDPAPLATSSPRPIKVCLLLRLGRADLAEAAWRAIFPGPEAPKPADGPPKLDLRSYGVSYLSLARDLAWPLYDRATAAHSRGDDSLALADARALDALARSVDATADALGFDRPDQPAQPPGRPVPYLPFLDRVPELLADQERRLRERSNPRPAPPPGVESREARIAALIRDLDQVGPPLWQGPANGQGSTTEADLIAEGDAAVEPLLWALRTDTRLTRNVDLNTFGRSRIWQGRGIQPVAQAASRALVGILKPDSSAITHYDRYHDTPETRNASADQIRAYWEKNRSVPLVERWYRTLLDDKAGAAAWVEAGRNIAHRDGARPTPAPRRLGLPKASALVPAPPMPLRGESLRKGHEPGVSALMARRVDAMLKSNQSQDFGLSNPCQMAGYLADWDPLGALPTLRELTRICRERYARPSNGRDWTNQALATSIARFTLARDQVGDTGAIPEYARWVRTIRPEWLEQNALAALDPLLRRPDDPDLAAAAAWLFEDPESPWVPLLRRDGSTFQVASLIDSPLVELPSFRKLLIRGLEDRTPIGTAEVNEGGGTSIKLERMSMGRSNPKDARSAPARSGEVPIRMGDFYAWQLTQIAEAPAFHACWPEPRRDAALIEMAAFLRAKQPRPQPR